MARRARRYLAGVPYHIVQRGNNRQPCFLSVMDFQYYHDLWADLAEDHGVDVHAYVLMANHIHFLVTPAEADSISRLMQLVNGRYAQYFNKRHRRSGSLWEGRHKASAVSAQYLLSCYGYIETNPVLSGVCESPAAYPWSSYAANALGRSDDLLVAHGEYLALAGDVAQRLECYRELVGQALDEALLEQIRHAIHFNHPLGCELFKRDIARKLAGELGYDRVGRPRKEVRGQFT